MAKKKDKPAGHQAGDTLTIDWTVNVSVKKPAYEILLIEGTELTVVEDGTGIPVDDVSKTVWKSYADIITASDGDKLGDDQ
jgi:hypothetical protein